MRLSYVSEDITVLILFVLYIVVFLWHFKMDEWLYIKCMVVFVNAYVGLYGCMCVYRCVYFYDVQSCIHIFFINVNSVVNCEHEY